MSIIIHIKKIQTKNQGFTKEIMGKDSGFTLKIQTKHSMMFSFYYFSFHFQSHIF